MAQHKDRGPERQAVARMAPPPTRFAPTAPLQAKPVAATGMAPPPTRFAPSSPLQAKPAAATGMAPPPTRYTQPAPTPVQAKSSIAARMAPPPSRFALAPFGSIPQADRTCASPGIRPPALATTTERNRRSIQRMSETTIYMDMNGIAKFKLAKGNSDLEKELSLAKGFILSRDKCEHVEKYAGTNTKKYDLESGIKCIVDINNNKIYYTNLVSKQRVIQYIEYIEQLEGTLIPKNINIGFISATIDDEKEIVATDMNSAISELKIIMSKFKGYNVSLTIMPMSIAYDRNFNSAVIKIYNDENFMICLSKTSKTINFLVNIAYAHGSISGLVIDVLRENGIKPHQVNLNGICGSLTPALGRETMVIPFGSVIPAQQGLNPVQLPYNSFSGLSSQQGGPTIFFTGSHGHVGNLLEETAPSVDYLLGQSVHTLEMESYFVAKALENQSFSGTFKMAFTVSDVVTSAEENMTKPALLTTESSLRRYARNKVVIDQFF